jgi:HSP20 family protein
LKLSLLYNFNLLNLKQREVILGTQVLAKVAERKPSVFDGFLTPWISSFDNGGLLGRSLNMPTINITEQKDDFHISLAAPGF